MMANGDLGASGWWTDEWYPLLTMRERYPVELAPQEVGRRVAEGRAPGLGRVAPLQYHYTPPPPQTTLTPTRPAGATTRTLWPPAIAGQAELNRVWANIQEGMTPWGRKLARQEGPPLPISRWSRVDWGPRGGTEEPSPMGYYAPYLPPGQRVAVYPHASRGVWYQPSRPRALGAIGMHELAHAAQERLWGPYDYRTGYMPTPTPYRRSLGMFEEAVTRAQPQGLTTGLPWGELYAHMAERPTKIPESLRGWYPQYWSRPVYGFGGRERQLLAQMGWQ